MGFDHGVTEERVVPVGSTIEHPTSVVDASKWVSGGQERAAGCDELREEINVGFKSVAEQKSMELEDRS
jgi:hypothetical protein